jgi:hypothetical protein
VYLYRGADTVALAEGYQYNAYHNKAARELLIQIDTVLCDTTALYIAADKTLAVKMSSFRAAAGDRRDTLFWKTESEHENLGFHLYRRVQPEYFEKIVESAKDSSASDSLVKKVTGLYKSGAITSSDTGWLRITEEMIAGAKGGTSFGPVKYTYVDSQVTNFIMYEYRLESYDFSNTTEAFGPVAVMPFIKLTLPPQFRLGVNFPNPFRRMTSIRFDLPVESRVSLYVYNLQGRLVRRLVKPDHILTPSSYHIIWDGKNDHGKLLGPGPYCYQIIADKYVKARVMIMLE